MATVVHRLALLLVLVCGLASAPSAAQSERIEIAVTVQPQAWLVERLGGDRVIVHVTVAPGQMPETYQPSDLEASRILKSTIFFRLGLPAERGPWFKAIERTGRPRVVDLRQGLELIEMQAHRHGGGHEDHGRNCVNYGGNRASCRADFEENHRRQKISEKRQGLQNAEDRFNGHVDPWIFPRCYAQQQA